MMAGLVRGHEPANVLYPHRDDMIQRVFPISEETLQLEAEMDQHFQAVGSAVRAGVVLLLKDLRCGGRPCKQNSKWGACTYLDQALRSIRSLLKPESLLARYPQYPILLYHSDWTRRDQLTVERESALNDFAPHKRHRVWWHRVTFGPDSLPPYLYDINRTVAGWREHHFSGDLARATKNNIHGFGYMLMCRLYSGLIHHAPLARKLDYYLRIDGDSRLTSVKDDPFRRMSISGKTYATYGHMNYKEVAGAAIALPYEFARRVATRSDDIRVHHRSCPAKTVACPTIAAPRGPHATKFLNVGQCDLSCHLSLPHNIDDPRAMSLLQMPVPLCNRPPARKIAHCPAFYNNFEIVDMRAFRTPLQWEFFLLAERAHVFLCEAFPGRSRPGKCGGGGMGDAMFRTIQVSTFLKPGEVDHVSAPQIVYRHPVPIASFCSAHGTIDGGPKVQSIDLQLSSDFFDT